MDKRLYLVQCEAKEEFEQIIMKHSLPVDECVMVYKDKHKIYERLMKQKCPKFEVNEKCVKMIKDLWTWCYASKVLRDYETEKMITKGIYDPIRWKEYNKTLHGIVGNYYDGDICIKYEMIKTYRLFRKMLLAGVDIGNCMKMIEFFYNEKERGNLYAVDDVLDRYIQVYKFINPQRFKTPLVELLNIKPPVGRGVHNKGKKKGTYSKLVRNGNMF